MNVPDLDLGGFRDKEVCKKYPGSGWMPYLYTYAQKNKIEVLSGSGARDALLLKRLEPKDILVVQEELNPQAEKLIAQGAKPGLLFCLESPLYAPFFYDAIPKLLKKFPAQMLFQYGTHPMYFPSFDLKDIQEPKPLDGRDKSCMVVSNKYYKFYEELFGKSPIWKKACESQLHDARYALITKFEKDPTFDLYGQGWPSGKAKPIPPGEKVNVMRDYLINYCFENIYMHGYLTEKLFDALMAGVAPIYLGAPNITDLVPKNILLLEESDNIEEVIDNGQKFLHSKAARRYSYQGFAQTVLELLKEVGDQPRRNQGDPATRKQAYKNNLSSQIH